MGDQEYQEHEDRKKNISRREFLKYSGTIIFVVGTGFYVHAEAGSGLPPSHGYLLVDIKKCQGCMSCMLACTLVHEGVENLSLSRIQIIQNSFESFPHDVTIEQCRQCADPACVKACPVDALKANPKYGNVRMVDRDKCIGCGACVEACPFTPSRPIVASDEHYSRKKKSRKSSKQ